MPRARSSGTDTDYLESKTTQHSGMRRNNWPHGDPQGFYVQVNRGLQVSISLIVLVDSEGQGLEVTIQPRAVNRAA
jgi:hypothetical protein